MADPREMFRAFVFPGARAGFPANLERDAPKGTTLVPVTTGDGLALTGALVRGGAARSERVAVFFHGNGESAAENLPFAAALARGSGVDVFLAEYRGYGGQPGSPSEEGVYADAEAAIAAAIAGGYAKEKLDLIGRSLGTGVAVEMAARGHGARLLLVSPFTSIPDVAARVVGPLAKMLMVDRFDSAAKIGRVKVPITVIHGTSDATVPFELGKKLSVAAKARLIPLEGRGHNDLFELPELLAEILRS